MTEQKLELGTADFQRCLDDLRPVRIGHYGLLLALLRFRCRQVGRFPERLHRTLLRFFNPEKPYFVGVTADGTKYLGNFRDVGSVIWAVEEDFDGAVVRLEGAGGEKRGVYLDIGANIGVLAASVARSLAGKGEVIAFEAIPKTARRAAATFALNGLTNIRLLAVALGDSDGEIPMFDSAEHSGWNSAYRSERIDAAPNVETKVPCRSLDSLARSGAIGTAGFIKIDVEGYELKVLQGAREFLARDQPGILYEYNRLIGSRAGWKATDASDLIRSAGPYRFQIFNGNGSLSAFPQDSQEEEYVNILASHEPAAPHQHHYSHL